MTSSRRRRQRRNIDSIEGHGIPHAVTIIAPQRHLFDIPDDVAYFNCAYYSPQLNRSRDALLAGVQAKSRPWERTAPQFFDDAERLRALCAELFGGGADAYAMVPSASYGLSAAARAIEPRLSRSDRILLVDEEFPSNVLPWRRVSRETGAVLETVPAPADGDWTRAILGRIEPGVRVVATSACRWTDGAWIDLRPIGRACRDVGSALVLDATQSLGAMPFPLADIQPDFVVAAGYKWLLCPYGLAFVYVAEQWREARPLEESWLARLNAEDFAGLVRYSDAYMPGARRFDSGEKCTPTILPGAIAALEQIRAWGIEAVAQTLLSINARIAMRLGELGFALPEQTRRCPHMFGARLPSGRSGNLVADLRAQNLHISQRGDALRFSPHLFVTANDVDRLTRALQQWIG